MKSIGKSTYQLVYAKKASVFLLSKIYYSQKIPCLMRKRFKIERALGIIEQRRDVGMVDKHA